MDIEQKKQQLDEYGKILLGAGGFFESMPEDQKDVFGNALALMAEIKAYEIIQEQMGGGFEINLNLQSIDLGKLFTVTPRPVYEDYSDQCITCKMNPCVCTTDSGLLSCGACNSNPCMCANCINDGCENGCICEPATMSGTEVPMTYNPSMDNTMIMSGNTALN